MEQTPQNKETTLEELRAQIKQWWEEERYKMELSQSERAGDIFTDPHIAEGEDPHFNPHVMYNFNVDHLGPEELGLWHKAVIARNITREDFTEYDKITESRRLFRATIVDQAADLIM